MEQKMVEVKTVLNEDLLQKVNYYAKRHYEDVSTAIRQLIAMGLVAIMKQEAITAYKNRKITLRETAELLGLNYWETQKILEEEGIPIIDLTTEEIEGKIK